MTDSEKDARIRELENDLVKESRLRYSNELILHGKIQTAISLLRWVHDVSPPGIRAKAKEWLLENNVRL